MFDDFFNTEWIPRANATAPAVNVREDEKAYTMDIAAPGLQKDWCRVSVNDEGNLEIALENKLEHKAEDKKVHYLRREFDYSNCQKTYELPEDVDAENISAKVEDGVLTVVLPKKTPEESSVKRQIPVA